MAVGFQCEIDAVVSLRNVNNMMNPLSQTLTIKIPAQACVGAATGEAAAVTATLSALSTAITTACATGFTNELIAQESAGG